jgi:N-hydroxyarylamine O-acetyltransferase
MPSAPIDVPAYFARIGYDGPTEPGLATLAAIVAAHATAIPFENLDVLLGRPVRLDDEGLMQKLVHKRRGGYCFEHNSLLWRVLLALGFTVEGLAARVVWRRIENTPGPRTHMLLRVILPEGDFLADVGFGGLTLTAPIRMQIGPEQTTPHEVHRLVEARGETELQADLDGRWTRLYHFSSLPQAPIDYEVANWYTATHPTSVFVNTLMAARPTPERRYTMLGRDFTIRHRHGPVERRDVADAAEFGSILREHFHIDMPDADLAEAWRRITNS